MKYYIMRQDTETADWLYGILNMYIEGSSLPLWQ